MGQSPPGHTYNKNGQGLPFYQGKIEFGQVYPLEPSTWCTEPKKIAEPDDVLLSVRAPVGPTNLCNKRCCIGRGLAAIRPKKGTNPLFILYYLRLVEEKIAEIGRGSTFGAIKKGDIESILIPEPPSLEQQKRIAAKIQELMQEVERARAACEKQLEAAKALPAAYLRQVFESEEAERWERRRLGNVCEIIMGQSPPSHTYNREGTGIPFLQGKIDFGQFHPTASVWCTKPLKTAVVGDVLISVRAPVGPTNIADQQYCIGRGLAAIRPLNFINTWFLLFYFRSIEKLIYEEYGGRGSTFGAMTKRHLENLEIPLPPPSVQHRIASELKEKMAQVDKLRASIEKQLEAINALPQAILRKAFIGEL